MIKRARYHGTTYMPGSITCRGCKNKASSVGVQSHFICQLSCQYTLRMWEQETTATLSCMSARCRLRGTHEVTVTSSQPAIALTGRTAQNCESVCILSTLSGRRWPRALAVKWHHPSRRPPLKSCDPEDSRCQRSSSSPRRLERQKQRSVARRAPQSCRPGPKPPRLQLSLLT